MRAKYYIPFVFFILVQVIYDLFGTLQSTNWSIFYFSGQYFAWLLLFLIMPSYKGINNLPKFVIEICIGAYIFIEVGKAGSDYFDYYNSVNSFEVSLIPVGLLITGLTYFLIKLWKR